jgi:hypothetical protein
MLRIAVVALLLASFSTPMAASYPTQQLVTSQPPAISLSQPAYLQPTALPGLETSIIGISDAATFGAGESYYRHYYSTNQAWNSDGTRMVLGMNPFEAYFVDGKTFEYQFTRTTGMPYAPKWSNFDPELMYGISFPNGATCCQTPTFGKYFPASNTWQPLHTFPEFTDMAVGGGKGNLSNDDRYAPLHARKPSDPPAPELGRTVVIWDTVTNTEVGRKNFPYKVGWAAMSPSGNYVVVSTVPPPGTPKYEIYDKQMDLQQILTVHAGGHADIGYDSAGREVILSATTGTYPALQTTGLADGVSQQQLPKPGEPSVTKSIANNIHISCRNILRPGYCYISGYAIAPPPNVSPPHDAFLFHEVFALKLDGSGLVERYSQDFAANWPILGGPVLDYVRSSMVTPNSDGSLVLFASDWRDASASAVVLDYVAGVDQDGDGVFDTNDNCVEDPNPLQADDDVPPDGVGNACDPIVVEFTSTSSMQPYDGKIDESSETSDLGGDVSATAVNFRVGEVQVSGQERQEKGFVAFDTSPLPDDATVKAATLVLSGTSGSGSVRGTPFASLGTCWVDVSTGGFGGDPALVASDFTAAATASEAAVLSEPPPSGGLATAELNAAGLAAIHLTGTTQLRIRFAIDDDNDNSSDDRAFWATEAVGASNRPKLTIEYVRP